VEPLASSVTAETSSYEGGEAEEEEETGSRSSVRKFR
jgi:hypothetical protein